MREEIEGRLWDDNGAEFTKAVGRWLRDLSAAFARMNERNYAAPWKTAKPENRTARPA